MDFYKIEGHNSAPQIFKEIILSKRTGKAEQHSPPIPTTHQEIETPVWECVWECLTQQYLHNVWNLGGTSQAQSPQTWQVLVGGNGKSWSLLDRSKPQPHNSKMQLCLHCKALCQIQGEVHTGESGCGLTKHRLHFGVGGHQHNCLAGHSIKYSWLATIFCRGKGSSKTYSKNQRKVLALNNFLWEPRSFLWI